MSVLTAPDRFIIAARMKGYLDKHDESVAILTDGLAEHPDDDRLLRFRGHRRISIRDLDGAIEDLTRASEMLGGREDGYELYQPEVEKDAMSIILDRLDDVRPQHLPLSEAHGQEAIYSSTFHTSVWYHLGVALYLRGDLDACIPVFAKAHETAIHAEGLVASLDWQYMALRRLGRDDEAAGILDQFRALSERDDSDPGYTERMRMYAGERTADDLLDAANSAKLVSATQLYGVGNWLLYNGETAKAKEVFRRVLDTGARYAFAYIAAEAELADTPLAAVTPVAA